MKRSIRPTRVLRLAAMALVAAWIYLPIYFMAVSALKAKSGIYTYPPTFYPTAFLLYQNFVSALNPVNYFGIHWVNVFINSYTFATAGALIALALGIPMAFALAHFDLPGKYVLAFNFLSLRFLPALVSILPLYLVWLSLHLLNNGISVIAEYGIAGLPWVIWLMWSFLEGIPHSVYEAAQVDGASNKTILLRIMLPAVKSGLLVAGVFAFLQGYNDYQIAAILGGTNTVTIPVALADAIQPSYTAWNIIFAIGFVNFLPAVGLALAIRKHWARALSFGLVK
jgi:multiple sugar transport system permease protein